jgi:hypothetical protein
MPPAPVAAGIASNTAFAATVATPASPGAQPLPSAQSLHLGDTAPSAVLRAAMPDAHGAKPAARWYTPSLDSNTPFPATPPSIPTPPLVREKPHNKPKTRLLIVIAMVLTVALVLAAVIANYLAPQ